MAKVKFSAVLALLLVLVGSLVFDYVNTGGQLSSGYGLGILVWNAFQVQAWVGFGLSLAVAVAVLFMLLGLKLPGFGFVGSLIIFVVFLTITLGFFGITIPYLSPIMDVLMVDSIMTTPMFGVLPIHISIPGYDHIGIGTGLMLLGSLFGFIAFSPNLKMISKLKFNFFSFFTTFFLVYLHFSIYLLVTPKKWESAM